MTRCCWKDCSGETVGALAHTYAPGGWVWYCANHSPASDYWQDQRLQKMVAALERIATALERDPRSNIAATADLLRPGLPGSRL